MIILPKKNIPEKPEIADDIWASATKNRHKSWLRKFMRAIYGPDFSCEENNEKSAELLAESSLGNAAAIPELLQKGAAVNGADLLGFTALMHAAESGHTKAVQVLLEHGADVNAVDNIGCAAVTVAAEAGHMDIVRLLLEHGANVDVLVLNDKFLAAATAGQWETALTMLEQGADINAEDEGVTALIMAAESGAAATAGTLLDRGADVHLTTAGRSALSVAAQAGHGEVARLLIDRGAELGQRELDEWLIDAADKGQLEMVKVLLSQGADVWAKDFYCRGRALDVAVFQGHDEIAAILREAEVVQPKPAWEDCGKEGTR